MPSQLGGERPNLRKRKRRKHGAGQANFLTMFLLGRIRILHASSGNYGACRLEYTPHLSLSLHLAISPPRYKFRTGGGQSGFTFSCMNSRFALCSRLRAGTPMHFCGSMCHAVAPLRNGRHQVSQSQRGCSVVAFYRHKALAYTRICTHIRWQTY